MPFISGAMTAKFKPVGGSLTLIGSCDTDGGFEITETFHTEDIKTDDSGDTIVDQIDRGSDCTVRFTFAEYDLVKAVIYAGRTQGTPKAKVGKLVSALSGELVLTPAAGSPAETEAGVGNSWVFTTARTIGDLGTLLSSRHRKGPLTLRALPDLSTGKHYSVITTPTS
jgi:hypothetical protein